MSVLLRLTLSGGAMILVVALLRALLHRKVSRSVWLVLWAIAVVRLLVPVFIPAPTSFLNLPMFRPAPAAAAVSAPAAAAPAPDAAAPEATITQRKTLKITRPGGVVRPSGKFGVKRPGATVAAPASAAAPAPADGGAVADIADIPDMPMAPLPSAVQPADEGPSWLWTLSVLVQAAACVAVGALAWLLYQGSQASYF